MPAIPCTVVRGYIGQEGRCRGRNWISPVRCVIPALPQTQTSLADYQETLDRLARFDAVEAIRLGIAAADEGLVSPRERRWRPFRRSLGFQVEFRSVVIIQRGGRMPALCCSRARWPVRGPAESVDRGDNNELSVAVARRARERVLI